MHLRFLVEGDPFVFLPRISPFIPLQGSGGGGEEEGGKETPALSSSSNETFFFSLPFQAEMRPDDACRKGTTHRHTTAIQSEMGTSRGNEIETGTRPFFVCLFGATTVLFNASLAFDASMKSPAWSKPASPSL
jgi:hypothetical protein